MSVSTTSPSSHVEGEEGLALARAIGWRSGEAYALIFLGFCLGSRGDYARALDALYLDLLALPHARAELEAALALARQTDSTHWIHCTAGFLAAVYLHLREWRRADELLSSVLAADAPAQTLGQRLVWCARAGVALAHGDAPAALAIVERLDVATANRPESEPAPILRLLLLRSEVLTALNRPEEAEAMLHAARDLAVRQGARPVLWRVYLSLGHVMRLLERHSETETACAAARDLVESLAAGIPEQDLSETFLRRAIALLPPTRTRSSRRVTRRPIAPLTARECDIAAEVARGKSNAAIASTLVLSERTVESHIGNILSKLGFRSRKAIAAWATEAGLGCERDEHPDR